MAYIYKRGDKWAYRAYAGKDPITGKDKQKSKSGFRTKKDAQLAASIFERQFHDGEYMQPSALTFGDMAAEWEKHYIVEAKESSLNTRRKTLKHVISNFGNDPIQKITKQEYQSFIDDKSKQVSRSYLSIIHSSACLVFKYAKDMNLIKNVPTEGVKLPKKKKTVHDIENEKIQDKFLEKNELKDFLLVAKNEGLDGDLLIFTTLAYTGIRIGELLALKWSDIDFDDNTLRVSKTYYNAHNKTKDYQLLTPKTDKSIRTISIDEVVVNLLLDHKHEQDTFKKENAPFYHDECFIFAGNEGYPRLVRNIGYRMERLLKKSGIKKDVTPHSFRHTHTSLLIEANVHVKEIQERLGHSDINTTMDIYAHMTKDIKKEASTKFSSLMESLSNTIYDET